MKIHFLGTNGWFDSNMGNTTCTLIDSKDYYIILDAGFGIHKINNYIKEDKPVYLFLSHFHIDHICGLHTLPMLKLKKLTIFGQKKLKKLLNIFVNHPFSSSFSEAQFEIELKELVPGKHNLPFEFECLPIKHVDPTFGYRIKLEEKIITYCSDTAVCPNDYKLAKNADLLIHECTLRPGSTNTWGHSNPEMVAKLAKKAKVKRLALTHLGAHYYNNQKIRIKAEKIAKKIFKNTLVAKDNLTIKI